jgi:hypothetical protein
MESRAIPGEKPPWMSAATRAGAVSQDRVLPNNHFPALAATDGTRRSRFHSSFVKAQARAQTAHFASEIFDLCNWFYEKCSAASALSLPKLLAQKVGVSLPRSGF